MVGTLGDSETVSSRRIALTFRHEGNSLHGRAWWLILASSGLGRRMPRHSVTHYSECVCEDVSE